MKKLFALVLSLALVVAFAVPALASGWAQLDTQVDNFKNITMDLYGLEIYPDTSAIGSLYAPLSTYYPIVKNSRVHFVLEINLPKTANVSPAMQRLFDTKGLEVYVGPSYITLDKDVVLYLDGVKAKAADFMNGAKKVEVDTANNEFYCEISNTTPAADVKQKNDTCYKFEFWGTVNRDGKDATVYANVGFYNNWGDEGYADWMLVDVNGDGYNEYMVARNRAEKWFHIHTWDNATNTYGNGLFFYTTHDTKDKHAMVDYNKGVQVYYNGTEYTITKTVNNIVAFRLTSDTTNTLITEGALYNNLVGVCEKIFGFLGFKYEEALYMTEAHFTHYFGKIDALEKTITYPTGNVVVAPVTPELPQTGDNASIVGFAMIAVALVAAAVVTVKKVRA
ncbi:MAG: LPXTG cell wall anchor domain-containing protein [Clostridiales bacterium]|nr:LPXTG cell wall anchor domain-containing protein [Clostridiales bacterium]